ncbi:hypothetical protein QAD02_019175 [Eretmocerus hayati]|uniref:Uncharacterized protein n=1 Tax=Eretmocerus hayati TaxID=131215 RepID=A0ACC2PK05_9HYME|nr:hypothetical protein QAD02_019175 [Eretmocerus hayati]
MFIPLVAVGEALSSACPFGEENPECSTSSREEFPYHAIIFLNSIYNVYVPESSGVIISNNYVLSVTNPLQKDIIACCNHSIWVGSHDQSIGLIEHKAELSMIGKFNEISLYKLNKHIEFDAMAWPISILEAVDGAKQGEQASYTSLIHNWGYCDGVILASKAIIYKGLNCNHSVRHAHSLFYHQPPEAILCADLYESQCYEHKYSALLIRGKLAGLSYDVPHESKLQPDWLGFYIDVSYYRDMIREHTGI